MKHTSPLGVLQQACAPKTAAKSVTPIVFTCDHWLLRLQWSGTSLYSTKRWSRI